MNVGATVRGPRSWSEAKLSIISVWPPAPEPKMTPTSVRFSSVSSKPGVGERLLRRRDPEVQAGLAPSGGLGVHPVGRVEGADLTGELGLVGGGSNLVMVSRPETPLTRLDQAVSLSLPTGLMTPRPVTTTRRS